jgi:3-oxoacyl-[acyl-carrier-protein] synthase-3
MSRVAVLGVGYRLPERIRGNDDPIFDWLKKHDPDAPKLFDGLEYRRVLDEARGVVDLTAEACRSAAADAKAQLADVDLLVGSTSVSWDVAPNGLCAVHAALGLSPRCRVIALNTDYTVFHDGLRVAHDAVTAGSATRALVVAGNNWTHHVDYHEAVSLAASDAAGAALVGASDDKSRFAMIDREEETDTSLLGAFYVSQRKDGEHREHHRFTTPLMTINPKTGVPAIQSFGVPVPPKIIARMLARHGLTGADVTLVAHQSSKSVHDAWNQAIQPKIYLSTLAELGDMVSSSVPVNLAKCYAQIQTDHLVLMGIGMEMHATALLYRRG